MAKGGPALVYAPEPLDSTSLEALRTSMERELQRVTAAFVRALAREVEFHNTAPDKPREGMVVGADGTNWDPGSGQGVYAYYNSVWNKL